MKTTQDIKVPGKIVEQVIGQDEAVNIIKKAAQQRRHVLLIGEPCTGKSMMGLALAELLPKSELKDILAYPNPFDENKPLIKEMPAGQGREEVKKYNLDAKQVLKNNNVLLFLVAVLTLLAPWWVRHRYQSDLMFTAFFLGGMLFLAAFAIMLSMGPRMFKSSGFISPKVIVDNFGKENAPFFDATGAHAGALLGDVLHDPFQCFYPAQALTKVTYSGLKEGEIGQEINSLFIKYKERTAKNEKNNYEALFLPKNELKVMGEKDGSVSPVEVLSSNRHEYAGEMIKLTTSENKELMVTPEHAVAIWQNGRINYISAKNIKEGDEVVALAGEILLDEQDIIETFDEKQQEQCKLYYQYAKIKKENESWGYKRISKIMKQPEAKTRWWHAKKHFPTPIQTIHWLKERGLLPLKMDNPKLPLIAKVLGATFGDGGIFGNLNAIFLSSSELDATKEFAEDLEQIFGKEIHENSRTIEGGIEGHSWCYQNTNRGIIRFFKALGAPIGKKTNVPFVLPKWVLLSEQFENEYFGSFLGNELGVPKVHKEKNRLDMLSVGISGNQKLVENKIAFLTSLRTFLENKGIKSTKFNTKAGPTEGTILCRLLISTTFDNFVAFQKNIKINYCKYKKDKLINILNEFKAIKKEKYHQLLERGYGAEHAMNLLQLTPKSLYMILNDEAASV